MTPSWDAWLLALRVALAATVLVGLLVLLVEVGLA